MPISRTHFYNFNPRSYKRSDLYLCQKDKEVYISIHAPTRGATFAIADSFLLNPFQSTLLQEERLCKIPPKIGLNNFNPRSYKRSDKT